MKWWWWTSKRAMETLWKWVQTAADNLHCIHLVHMDIAVAVVAGGGCYGGAVYCCCHLH